ncbi:MAG: haloacid dehalogenase-like hydrolase [Planctomycetota bacterium]|nr:haloacid dehalogenase-like hydrolase [Planctomycetota bacterium]
MLILFDVDATLITTGGAGLRALVLAGQSLYGPDFSDVGVDVAGRLDPLIISEMLTRAGVRPSPEAIAAVRESYLARLPHELRTSNNRALPGVQTLLEALSSVGSASEARAILGLLTGNFRETAHVKLRVCGIDPERFKVAAWGDDSPHEPPAREHLPPVAVARHAAMTGRQLAARDVLIIGDTPHDAACARAHNHRALGVATGRYSIDQLRESGFDHVVPDLSDTQSVLEWILSRR